MVSAGETVGILGAGALGVALFVGLYVGWFPLSQVTSGLIDGMVLAATGFLVFGFRGRVERWANKDRGKKKEPLAHLGPSPIQRLPAQREFNRSVLGYSLQMVGLGVVLLSVAEFILFPIFSLYPSSVKIPPTFYIIPYGTIILGLFLVVAFGFVTVTELVAWFKTRKGLPPAPVEESLRPTEVGPQPPALGAATPTGVISAFTVEPMPETSSPKPVRKTVEIVSCLHCGRKYHPTPLELMTASYVGLNRPITCRLCGKTASIVAEIEGD